MGFFDLFGKKDAPAAAEPERTIVVEAAPISTTSLTQEQLKARRVNMIENARFGRPMHERVMSGLLKIWMIVGPIAFVALTTAEVAYILGRLMPEGDTWGQFVIWGGALFIDLAMMLTTFGVALKRRAVAEKEDLGTITKRDRSEATAGTAMWLIFALINITGQTAFLWHVIEGSPDAETQLPLLIVFMISRVVGFILGDAVTAFFLAKVDENDLKLVARAEREKGSIYLEVAQAEGERRLAEAKAEAEIERVQIEAEQKREEATFMAQLRRDAFQRALSASRGGGELGPGTNTTMKRLS